MMTKTLDRGLCDRCGLCIRICANSRVIEADADGMPRWARLHQCIDCGHCLAVCPRGAIRFAPQADGTEGAYAAPAVPVGTGASADAVADLLASLRSTREFDDRPVARGELDRILEAMVRSPSAGNEQNRSFYVYDAKDKVDRLEAATAAHYRRSSAALRSPLAASLYARSVEKARARRTFARNTLLRDMPRKELREAIRGMLSDLARRQDAGEIRYFHGAPAAVLVTSRTDAGDFHKPFHKADAAIAVTYGTVMAAALGLATCWVGLAEIAFRDGKGLKARFGIPGNERVDGILALGHSPLRWRQAPPRGPVKAVWA